MTYAAVSFDANKAPHWSPTSLSTNLPDVKGIFETFRLDPVGDFSFRGFGLHRHFVRAQKSVHFLNGTLPSFEEFIYGIQKGLTVLKPKKNAPIKVRLQLCENLPLTLVFEEFTPRLDPTVGVRLISFDGVRSAPTIKSLPATTSICSHQFALQHLADEALLLTDKKSITETSWGNFFVLHQDGSITTSNHCLLGIAREIILSLFPSKIKVKEFLLDSFFSQQCGAFITNSLHDVIPVTMIDGLLLPSFALTKEVQNAFASKRSLFEEAVFFYAG